MQTQLSTFAGDARDLGGVADDSIHLVVTSPPYPMIEMWDGLFKSLGAGVAFALENENGAEAFALMHQELDRVWRECHRVVVAGGLVCINIGDATRTMRGGFRLYSNHARVIYGMEQAGFVPLPDVLWRKPTNAPNKFMGSGMLPAGAYVTYEHEYILVFRKGDRRKFRSEAEKQLRRQSAFFWEERNRWFSDLWSGISGMGQEWDRMGMNKTQSDLRAKSAAFPLAIPLRLIAMYSLYGDMVLDPFMGAGTTILAAGAMGRNGVGFELVPALANQALARVTQLPDLGHSIAQGRIEAHLRFVEERTRQGKPPKYWNEEMACAVMTRQERQMRVWVPQEVESAENAGNYRIDYRCFENPERDQAGA